jgi:hypothetical protein
LLTSKLDALSQTIKKTATKVAVSHFNLLCGERGSRTYEIIENHKISIRCKLSVYKIVKFIETHRVHFDI